MMGHIISPEFNVGEHTDAAAMIGTAALAIKSMAEPIFDELGSCASNGGRGGRNVAGLGHDIDLGGSRSSAVLKRGASACERANWSTGKISTGR